MKKMKKKEKVKVKVEVEVDGEVEVEVEGQEGEREGDGEEEGSKKNPKPHIHQDQYPPHKLSYNVICSSCDSDKVYLVEISFDSTNNIHLISPSHLNNLKIHQDL